MKKEKQVKSYTRRTKGGKTVTVRAYSAKYDAADAASASKREGAGGELDELKKRKSEAQASTDTGAYEDYGFTQEEFGEWYEGTGSKADKKVEKLLRKQLGKEAYDNINDLAANGYKKGGAGKFFETLHTAITYKKSTNKAVAKDGNGDNGQTVKSKNAGVDKETKKAYLVYGVTPKNFAQWYDEVRTSEKLSNDAERTGLMLSRNIDQKGMEKIKKLARESKDSANDFFKNKVATYDNEDYHKRIKEAYEDRLRDVESRLDMPTRAIGGQLANEADSARQVAIRHLKKVLKQIKKGDFSKVEIANEAFSPRY